MRRSRLHQEKNNRIEKEKGDEKGKDGEQQDVGGSQVLLLQLLLLLVLLACWVWPGMKEILQGREIIITKWVIKRKDLRRKRSARPRPKMTQGKRRKDRSTVRCSSSISNSWRCIIRSMFRFQFLIYGTLGKGWCEKWSDSTNVQPCSSQGDKVTQSESESQYGAVIVCTWWYWVALGQYRAERFNIWCYWVSMKWNWLIRDNTGSVEGGTG